MKRLLDPSSLHALARGCAVLGAGGGGDTYLALLQALQATEDYGPVALVDLDELPDDELIMPCGGIGAPTVSIEKIENGDEGERLRDHLEGLTGRRVAALMAGEIGGGNGLVPVAWAARMGLPVVDADGMGRAFPEVTPGHHAPGRDLAEPGGDDRRARQRHRVPHRVRGLDGAPGTGGGRRVRRGGLVGGVHPDRGAGARRPPCGTRSRWRSGSARRSAGREGSPVAALIAEIGAFRLVTGKVVGRGAADHQRVRPRARW